MHKWIWVRNARKHTQVTKSVLLAIHAWRRLAIFLVFSHPGCVHQEITNIGILLYLVLHAWYTHKCSTSSHCSIPTTLTMTPKMAPSGLSHDLSDVTCKSSIDNRGCGSVDCSFDRAARREIRPVWRLCAWERESDLSCVRFTLSAWDLAGRLGKLNPAHSLTFTFN